MTTEIPGAAVSETGIEWLNPEDDERVNLTDREQMLIKNAYADGYADGERHGFKVGGQEALKAATELTSLMGSTTWQRSMELLRYFAELP